jgi:hypothetical protein
VVFDYYKDRFDRDYSELIQETDRIDAADLTLDEVVRPEKYAYVLLSMTLSPHKRDDEPYWNRLVTLLRGREIQAVMEAAEVARRCRAVITQNRAYREDLINNTSVKGQVAITDFRSFEEEPVGNRFLVYSLFPESVVNVKIRHDDNDRDIIRISVGHSIFNRNCQVNVGLMMSRFGGGGHPGAGACRTHIGSSEKVIADIVAILLRNEPLEGAEDH